MRYLLALLIAMLGMGSAYAQDLELLKGSVVKIVSKSEGGPSRTGTGFVVAVEDDLAYVVTASHVIEGDSAPQVEFFHARNKRVKAEVGKREGGDPKGLAYLVVRDRSVAARGIKPLALGMKAELRGGQEVFAIGFGAGQGDWAVIKATIASIEGRDIKLDGRIEEGNSGGPLLKDGQVVGLITGVKQGFGIASPALIVNLTLEGWNIKAMTAPPATEASDTPRDKETSAQPPAQMPSRPSGSAELSGQYVGQSQSRASNGQQYVCDFMAAFTQAGNMVNGNFQNTCGDSGTIQGQILGNQYHAQLNSVSLGYCKLIAEIYQAGRSLAGQILCVGLAGRFTMAKP